MAWTEKLFHGSRVSLNGGGIGIKVYRSDSFLERGRRAGATPFRIAVFILQATLEVIQLMRQAVHIGRKGVRLLMYILTNEYAARA